MNALSEVSLRLREGDRLGIIGRNGAGKSTLCRCLAGILRPESGSVEVQGRVRAVFDPSLAINSELSGRENAHLLAELLYAEHPSRQELAREALDFADLGKFVDAPFRTYSHGMKSRLGLSLASCSPGDLLILDEVMEGADIFFREKISERFLGMISRSKAVVLVSHSEEQIRKVCNRVLVLHSGRAVYDGPVNEGLQLYVKGGAA